MRLVYNYHPETGRFLQATEADESPLEEGVYLIPAFATEIEPPDVVENQYCIFIDGSWAAIENPVSENELVQAPTAEQMAVSARQARNGMLSESDWTQLPDTVVDKVAWATYRQALRDISNQAGFPVDINWPASPA